LNQHRRTATPVPARHARTDRAGHIPVLTHPVRWARNTVTHLRTTLILTAVNTATSMTASCLDWLAYWPDLAFTLTRLAATLRTAGRALRRTARTMLIHARQAARWAAPRLTRARRRAACLAGRAARAAGRLARQGLARLWRAMEPHLRDAAGWLVHRAPGLLARALGRILLRLARWLPLALVRLAGYGAIGAGWLVTRTATYCAAYPEYAPLIALAREEDRPRRVYALTQQWRRAALRRTGFFLAVGLLAWLGWTLAVHTWGTPAQVLMLATLVLACATVGRIVRPPRARDDAPVPDPDVPENAPYPIADAHTRAEAADCVARALTAEGIALRMTGEAARTRWGWTVPVILRTGTPAAIVAKTGDLETHLDLPAGGVLATPDRTRRARVVLRLAQTDPFVGLGYAPSRQPGTGSIIQRAVIGQRIDAEPLTVPLLGVHAVVIGSPGSGKSTTLLALGDAISACTDALVWDLDPAGDGLRALGSRVGRRERDTIGIESALADALALAEVRPKMLGELGMGAAWEPTPQRPALVVIVDEYPRLSTPAKQCAVQLLRVGRKARVTLILAATEATSDALGAAIADTTALKIMHACRFQDIQLVLGPQMGAEGWRPDRLHPATADDPGDAGRCYVATAGHREPLLSKVAPVDVDQYPHRASLTVPRIDTDSWVRARAARATDHPGQPGGSGSSPTGGGAVPGHGALPDHEGITDVLTVLTVFGADRRLWTEQLVARLAEHNPRYREWTGEDVAAVLRPLGVSPVQVWREGRNRRGYPREAIARALYGQITGQPATSATDHQVWRTLADTIGDTFGTAFRDALRDMFGDEGDRP
jgi:S-DNA-T family DNA segregation ATPase FtsK/SpoIIIE